MTVSRPLRWLLLAVAVLVAGFVAVWLAMALYLLFGPSRVDDRFATPGNPITSPSGNYLAEVVLGPEQNGVDTWKVRIRDTRTQQVEYADDYAYSTRHGIAVTWLSTKDQLWMLSNDVGDTHVDRDQGGTWRETGITPETVHEIPAEIAQYG